MSTMLIIPAVKAWEYYDTWIYNPKTDRLYEPFGPRADKIEIKLYDNETDEFEALSAGKIDLTDGPINYTAYQTWTAPPKNISIAVVNAGPEFGLTLLDMRCNNDTNIQTTGPNILNPAFNAKHGNPMADVWLRRAICCICDRPYFTDTIISGNQFPRLATPLYTDLSPAYGAWGHPGLAPGLTPYVYCDPSGNPIVAQGNAYLDAHGYVYDSVSNARYNNQAGDMYKFTIEFVYRSDDSLITNAVTDSWYGIQTLMTAAPPGGLGLSGNLVMVPKTTGGARLDIVDTKKSHLYMGSWGLNIDPDHLYYLFSKVGYWHPGRPNNYMGYPGDLHDDYTVPTANWQYTGFESKYSWAGSGFNFSDMIDDPLGPGDPDGYWTAPKYKVGDVISQNPANYWSRQMMVATTQSRAQYCAYKTQEFLAFYACGCPLWASSCNTAFYRTYTGGGGFPPPPGEGIYIGSPWEGVVDQYGVGVGNTWSLYNMHPANTEVGSGRMTIRQGFRAPILSLNPLYADWTWDWYVLDLAYDSMIKLDPYTLDNAQNLAASWDLSTWNNTVGNPHGTICTNVTFHMRHDLFWSDGVPITASDVKFTWGGPAVTGSISNLIAVNGNLPPTYWSANLLDIVSVATPDPWTVNVLLDTYAYFSLHSMSGLNIVLPEHIWRPILPPYSNPTNQWNQPNVCSGGWIIDSTASPSGSYPMTISLSENPRHNMIQPDSNPPTPVPLTIWSTQTSNATVEIGNIHWIYPNRSQYTVDLTDNIHLHVYYVYTPGPYMSESYPYTKLDGLKSVTLWQWIRGTGGLPPTPGFGPAQGTYTFNRTLESLVPMDLFRCQDLTETFSGLVLNSGWYYLEISLNITSLAYSPDGITYTSVSPANNPFYNMTKVYREYICVTSRYDIAGAFWKRSGSSFLQVIPDLKVNVVDTFTASLAFGSAPGYANWNPAADVNGPNGKSDGKVNLQDTFAINLAFGSVF